MLFNKNTTYKYKAWKPSPTKLLFEKTNPGLLK